MNLTHYFDIAIQKKASDLHLVEGACPSVRICGELQKIENNPVPHGELRYAIERLLDKKIIERFNEERDLDISFEIHNNRFRVNLHYQGGRVGLAARLVPAKIPEPEDIGFNETIYNFTHLNDGLLLVTGPSGAGKSTSLACMINLINQERKAHIITIEDPIEYAFEDKQSIVEQRQLGRDTQSFASALKFALRQDPNVIMVGEMRDLDTISSALTAAKTGHLVLSTLHTNSAPETIQRIVDYYPAEYEKLITNQLASVLRGVISQQLLPRREGGLVAAREIMINNSAISNLIRNHQIEQMHSVIQTSRQEGMITMNRSIDDLLANGLITQQIANNRKRDLETKATYY